MEEWAEGESRDWSISRKDGKSKRLGRRKTYLKNQENRGKKSDEKLMATFRKKSHLEQRFLDGTVELILGDNSLRMRPNSFLVCDDAEQRKKRAITSERQRMPLL